MLEALHVYKLTLVNSTWKGNCSLYYFPMPRTGFKIGYLTKKNLCNQSDRFSKTCNTYLFLILSHLKVMKIKCS